MTTVQAYGRKRILVLIAFLACALVAGCGAREVGSDLPDVSAYGPFDAVPVEPRTIAASLEAYKGRNVAVMGEAIFVEQGQKTLVQLLGTPRSVEPTVQDTILVIFSPGEIGVSEGECYTIYGVVYGSERVTRVSTDTVIEMPAMRGYQWVPQTKAAEGLCLPESP